MKHDYFQLSLIIYRINCIILTKRHHIRFGPIDYTTQSNCIRTKRRTSKLKLRHRQQCKNDHRMHQSEFRIAPRTKTQQELKVQRRFQQLPTLVIAIWSAFSSTVQFFIQLSVLEWPSCYAVLRATFILCPCVILWCASVCDLTIKSGKSEIANLQLAFLKNNQRSTSRSF